MVINYYNTNNFRVGTKITKSNYVSIVQGIRGPSDTMSYLHKIKTLLLKINVMNFTVFWNPSLILLLFIDKIIKATPPS